MKVTVERIHQEAPGIQTIVFTKPQHFRYTAGQFIELYIPHDHADDRGQKRWFTLSSSPSEGFLSITTRWHGETSSTFKQHLCNLQPGTQIEMSEAMGDFVLPKNTHIPLVFVAGGIGVTPFRSIVQWLIDSKEQRSIQFIYAAKQGDLVFIDLFRKYDMQIQTLVNQRLSAALLQEKIPGIDEKLVFIAGPEPMTESIVHDLKADGFPYEQLVTDYFPGYK